MVNEGRPPAAICRFRAAFDMTHMAHLGRIGKKEGCRQRRGLSRNGTTIEAADKTAGRQFHEGFIAALPSRSLVGGATFGKLPTGRRFWFMGLTDGALVN